MATVNKIFKPRRGKKSTMAGTKANTVLAAGELFLETPDTGVGKGASKIKIGDGSTAYSSLPYALGDTTNDVITYSSNSSTSVATALNNVASGKKLGVMIAGLKQAVSLLNTSVTSLNDDITNIEQSFQDGCDTIVSGCTTYGSTPKSNSPTDIVTAIKNIYTNRYNSGSSAGYTNGYNAGVAGGGKVQYLSAGTHTLSFTPSGAISIGYVNDRAAFHWLDNVRGINIKQYGYNGDNGQPTWVTINGNTVKVSGSYNLAYKY